MSRSSTKKTASTAAAPAAARPRASAPLRRSGSAAATSAAHLTSQRIAADVAAFKKAGGRIEVLGNTPLRPYTARSTTRKATKVEPKAAKAGTKG
ncbi:hypothetical protein H9645_02090 [Luteimonas sp. Sa2BVA3]|uniref:Histone H1 n=1 Tax=Luteimonas colneyensis TaxID=2762230 RepID=A0ABR8UFM7_9GAMM|nr:hypothetical protein [Luteimonas colneyensis]MBD7986817.1 hypothetical protein [Luteimonas colneyensis]